MAARIRTRRHRDRHRRQGPRQDRPRPPRRPQEAEGLRRGAEHRQAPPAPAAGARRPARRAGRRRDREGGPDPPLQRHAGRPQGDKPTRVGIEPTRTASASRVAKRSRNPNRSTDGTATPARLKERYETEITPELVKRFGYSTPMQAPAHHQDHPEHGRRRRQAGLEDARGRDRAARDDRRPEAQRAPRAQVDRQLQAARGHAGRRRRDAARRALLRVPRPADVDRDPADPRLPRPEPALVRRPRQLLARHPRADHLPRDRLRRDRPGPRPRRHDHHDGRQTDEEAFALLLAFGMPFSQGGPARRPPTPTRRRTPRRSAARRRRGPAPRPSRRRSSSSRRRTPRPTPSASARPRRTRRAPRARRPRPAEQPDSSEE